MSRPYLLIVDDNRDLAEGLALVLGDLDADVDVSFSAGEALQKLRQRTADVIVSDIRMPGGDGLSLLDAVTQRWSRTRVILLTGFGTIQMAVDAIKRGAFHYLTKPFDNEEVLVHVTRAMREARQEAELEALRAERDARQSFCGIVTRDRRMFELFETIRRVAPSGAAILIRGESGTGKELIAQALHQTSDRKQRRFVAFNAAAVPESLAEAELFGAKKGAFTGAQTDRKGLFQLADGGTLFIDEVASMPMALQSKLLRALQEREIRPLGAERALPVDVRVISALNEDPAELVKEGRLRADLYYRLAVVTLHLPALRERPDDIGLLATHFLSHAGSGGSPKELSAEALRRLLAHDWPGNVRELSNVIERAALMCPDRTVRAEDIRIEGARRAPEPPSPISEAVTHPVDLSVPYEDAKRQAVDTFQRGYIEALLDAHGGNISAAANAAGITRAALHRILKRWQEEDDAAG